MDKYKRLQRKVKAMHKKKFPDMTYADQNKKVVIEFEEFRTANTVKDKLEEYADVFISLSGESRFANIDMFFNGFINNGIEFYGDDFYEAVVRKAEIVENADFVRTTTGELKRVKMS